MMDVASSFDISVVSGGPLSSYLSSSTATGIFGALSSGSSNATEAALTSGALTNKQHTVLTAIGGAGSAGYAIGWNSTGTEPSALATMRNDGWLKLNGKSYDSSTKTFEGTYTLTPIGKAILTRTGGGQIGADAGSSADVTQSVDDTLSSQVSNLTSTLSSLGVDVSV